MKGEGKHTMRWISGKGKSGTTYCGREVIPTLIWCFTDVDHLVLSVGGSIRPCKECVQAIINELQKEL